ncbi:hypothetical protein PINS_up012173 [Pythium insidiosum]|nr:hypothetical protein PINS_up012173 [Pythium insidiosum]
MNAQAKPIKTLEFAPPCRQFALSLVAIYLVSFAVTWFRVWWDSVFGLVVAIYGFWTLRDASAYPNERSVLYVRVLCGQSQYQRAHSMDVSLQFHKASIASMVSHAIALAVVLYYMLKGHIFDDILNPNAVESDNPTWTFYGFLIFTLAVEITITVRAVQHRTVQSLASSPCRSQQLTERGTLHRRSLLGAATSFSPSSRATRSTPISRAAAVMPDGTSCWLPLA